MKNYVNGILYIHPRDVFACAVDKLVDNVKNFATIGFFAHGIAGEMQTLLYIKAYIFRK